MTEPHISSSLHAGAAAHAAGWLPGASMLPLPVLPPLRYVPCFIDFYREIAALRQAQEQARLAEWVQNLPQAALPGDGNTAARGLLLSGPAAADASGTQLPVLSDSALAARISAHLQRLLRQTQRELARHADAESERISRVVLYLLAALADELLLLEIDWPGRDAWLDFLLEQKLFNTNQAGATFFKIAGQFLRVQPSNPLVPDLAALLLFMLELGFKGRHRGAQGRTVLLQMRQQLYHQVQRHVFPPGLAGQGWAFQSTPAFAQAYQYRLHSGADERLAPLSPWYRLALYALAGYLLLSALVWLLLMQPFESFIGH